MKDILHTLKTFFARLGRKKSTSQRVHPDSPRPDRDWALFLIVFLVLLIGVGVYSYQLFFTVVHGDLARHTETLDTVQTLDKDKLIETVEWYQEKRAHYFSLGGVPLPNRINEIVISDEITPTNESEEN